ncbi:MAG: (2Fe-2S) ferredoxin domain-containing protein [Synechococcales bacterium]|nr:(2Fe-2S) ferredoxin domain-containing protein [Synechococcales bacterium]
MSNRCVLVCQNRTCKKGGAATVLSAFQSHAPADVNVVSSGCLGQCGNGPMVLVLPDEVWYCRVRSDEVSAISQGHLREGRPVQSMLYPKYHPRR